MQQKNRKAQKSAPQLPPDPYMVEEIRSGLLPFWRVEDRMSQKWGGIVRLQSLVSPELSAKYGAAKAKLDLAIKALDAEETARRASVCIRGLEALDKAASESHESFEPRSVFISHHGRSYIVAIDRTDVAAIKAPEGVPVLSIQELLEARQIVLDGQIAALDAIQNAFQGAKVSFLPDGDDLPF
jgi:hypothetical protein